MHKPTAIRKLLALAFLAALGAQTAAASDQELEDGLINALRLKKGTAERVGNSGKAIQAYMQQGLVTKKPNQRADQGQLVDRKFRFIELSRT